MRRVLFLLLLSLPLFAGDRYIVQFRERPAVGAFGEDGDARVRRRFSRVFHGMAIELQAGESIDAIARLPYVARVTPDREVRAYGQATAGAGHVPRIVSHASTGAGITVAVIDTGIDYTHPALGGGIGPGRKVIGGWDFVNDDPDPRDDNRHGTHVAGIIAAQSGEMTGIAPGVSLLAYKVLNAGASGSESDIIAAIERAVDPNGDGDSSDRADVINLSLGTAGHPNDPMALAVDYAVAQGSVVVVAAGNDETFHVIGSPASAVSAITVGATDRNETIAPFSSRGPSTGNGAVKPDLVAPGTSIRSTGLDGAFIELSGTSMASPYVAGLAALLLAEHPEWTPARIKSALVTTAVPLDAEEVMTQGSGAVHETRPFAADLFFTPAQVSFGLDASTATAWTAARTIAITNDSTSPRTITVHADGTTGAISLAVPEPFTLAAGETRAVAIAVTADHALLPEPPTGSLSFGGAVTFEWDGGSARLPWAFVRAGRVTTTYSGTASPSVYWNMPPGRYASSAYLGPTGIETLVEPGTYDIATVVAQDGDVRVFVAEQQPVEGDVVFAYTPAHAPHEVRMDALSGRVAGEQQLYSANMRLLMPQGSVAVPLQGRAVHASSFSERYGLLLTESFVDLDAREIRIAQHPPVRGLAASAVLHVDDWASQPLRLHTTGEGTRRFEIMPRDWPRNEEEFGPRPASIAAVTNDAAWSGTLFMTPEVHPDYAGGVQMSAAVGNDPGGLPRLITPMVRRTTTGFMAARRFDEPPLPVKTIAGETLSFGDGPLHLPAALTIDEFGIIGWIEMQGDRFETHRQLPMTYRVTEQGTGALVNSGNVPYGTSFLPIHRKGLLVAELRSDAYRLDGRAGSAVLTLYVDTRNGAATPPSLTSLMVLDGAGRHATHLPRNGNGAVFFSVAGARTPAAFFRRRGLNTWVQLTTVETSDDVYRVDLTDALRFEGEIELVIELTDEEGTTAAWHLTPAFVVDPAAGLGRRRAVRH